MRHSTNNEITYIETNKFPLKCRIYKQQLKFWQNIKEYMENNPESALCYFVRQAELLNIKYVKHYQQLESRYQSPDNCLESMQLEYQALWKSKFEKSRNDVDSRLGIYIRINPALTKPAYISKVMLETDRELLSKFRCGSHSLNIEIGRFARPHVPREERLCRCNEGLQTILHCFNECEIVKPYIGRSYEDLEAIFNDDDVCMKLLMICKVLKIPF